jgi:hypothetical protein
MRKEAVSSSDNAEDTSMLAPESVLAWIVIGGHRWMARRHYCEGLRIWSAWQHCGGHHWRGDCRDVGSTLRPLYGVTASFAGNVVASALGAVILLLLIGLLRRA